MGTPTFDQTYFIPIIATDPYGASVTSTLTIIVRANSPPLLLTPKELLFEVLAGDPFALSLPANLFTDPDSDVFHYYLDSSSHSWFYFNPLT